MPARRQQSQEKTSHLGVIRPGPRSYPLHSQPDNIHSGLPSPQQPRSQVHIGSRIAPAPHAYQSQAPLRPHFQQQMTLSHAQHTNRLLPIPAATAPSDKLPNPSQHGQQQRPSGASFTNAAILSGGY